MYLNVHCMTIFVMPIGNDWHCPANIFVIHYMCNVKVKKKKIKKKIKTWNKDMVHWVSLP